MNKQECIAKYCAGCPGVINPEICSRCTDVHHVKDTWDAAVEETKKEMIDKACKWIEEYLPNEFCVRVNLGNVHWEVIHTKEFVEKLKQAMEE